MRARLTFALALAFVAPWAGAAAGATEEAPDGPSPLWWTLTDEITPRELRAALADPELSRERYADAVAAGYAAPVPEASLRSIRLFYTGALTPELVPMWQAFHGFAAPMRGESASRLQAKARFDLKSYGFEAAAVEAIVGAALGFLDRAESLQLGGRIRESS